MQKFLLGAALIAAIIVIALFLHGRFPGMLDSWEQQGRLVSLVGFLALLLLAFGGERLSMGRAARYAAIWLVIFGALGLGYAYRGELSRASMRLMSELSPSTPMVEGDKVTLSRGPDGHYSTMAIINGERVLMLVDTGASSVVLPFHDAIRLGFNSGDLVFNRQVMTASGPAFEAPITLEALRIGDIVLHDVSASVAEPGHLDRALLGMSFLNRLDSYAFKRGKLTLSP